MGCRPGSLLNHISCLQFSSFLVRLQSDYQSQSPRWEDTEYSVLLAAYLDTKRGPKNEWDLSRGSAGCHCLEYSQTLWNGLNSLYSNSILQLPCPLLPSFLLQSSHIIPAIPKYSIVLYTVMSYLFPLSSHLPHLVIKSKQNFYQKPSVFECKR